VADSLPSRFRDRARRHPSLLALAEQDGPSMTWGEWDAAVDACAAAIVRHGHGAGERGAVFAGNTLLWPVADLALQSLGLVSVGVFPTSPAAQLQEVLADCGATIAFVDTPERLAALLAVRPALPGLRTVVAACPAPDGVERWGDWLDAGRSGPPPRYPVLQPYDDAIIIYTSGSTGDPRGARISHRYLLASADSIQHTLALDAGERTLSFLPFSHAAERVFGHARRIVHGGSTMLVPDHRRLWEAAAAFQPTLFGGLPRFYEKLHDALQARRRQLAGTDAARWDAGVELGRRRSQLRRCGQPVPVRLEEEWLAASEAARAVLQERLGAALRVGSSGGASLPQQVAEELDASGLTILGAYGLTEHLCVASNRPQHYDFAGAGPAMEGSTVRISPDGEVLVHRCDLTFTGYLNREEETRAMFTADGDWLRTGDLGSLDNHILRITGRIKELIALSTGKKVAPAPIEARLTLDPWIGQAVLHGEGRSYMTALLSLRREVVEAWAAEQGLAMPYGQLVRDHRVRRRIAAALERVNADVSAPERVRRFVVIDRDLDEDHGEVTPTLKIRRSVVAEHFADQFEALYREETA
jgi:long-chain acyl-CoA synthetase